MITDDYVDKLYAEIYKKDAEIARLDAENARLRGAITIIGKLAAGYWSNIDDPLSKIMSLAHVVLKENRDE